MFRTMSGPAGRLSLFYWCLFLVIGVFVPFWPVWLADRGMDATEIGVLLAIGTWVKVLGNPLVGQVVDRRGDRRRPMIVLSGAALLAAMLFGVAQGFWALLAVSALYGFLLSSLFPLADNLTVRIAAERGLQYGRIRLWGSLSFIAAAAVGGRVLAGQPPGNVLWLVLGALALMAASTVLLPDARWPPAPRRAAPARRLMRHPVFLLFLVGASLVQSSHAVYYGFATLHWRAAGHADDLIGGLWAEGVVAEILLFLAGGAVLARLGPQRLLVIAALGGIVRWSVTGLTDDLVPLVLVQVGHALTFGATHLASVHFIARAAPEDLSASAQSLYAAFGTGIGFGIMLPVAGWLYDAWAGGAFLFMAGMSALALVAALALGGRWNGERLVV
jgi:PPP family 3-phenylpropionic acid transporter